MADTSTALVVRQQAWFRPLVNCENLALFPLEKANIVHLHPPGVLRARVLIGRGPVKHELPPQQFLYFDHGEEPYPVLECPSIGPKGAALRMSNTSASINACEGEAISLFDVCVVQPVEPTLPEQYKLELAQHPDTSGRHPVGPASSLVRQALDETRKYLDQAVGLYALYQYPIVWEPLGMYPYVAFVNLESQISQQMTSIKPDNFVPFLLNAGAKIQNGYLVDDALVNLHLLADGNLHIPLVLLQRSLWQKNVEVRFLETFLVIEHLAGRFVDENEDQTWKQLYTAIEQFVGDKFPQHQDRLSRLKSFLIKPSLRQRLANYFNHLGLNHDDILIKCMLKLRNDLAHGGNIDPHDLTRVELDMRVLVRQIMLKELSNRGVQFGDE